MFGSVDKSSDGTSDEPTVFVWFIHLLKELSLLFWTPLISSFGVDFDDFQLKIFKFLVGILVLNITLFLLAWKHFGEKITDRFMRPVSAKVIEELKTGAVEFKLPAEHSPRI